MKNKKFVFYLLSTIFFFGFFYACVQDEGLVKHKNSRFFDASGADQMLQKITPHLMQKNDSEEFVTDFVNKYGYPIWQSAVQFCEGENIVFAVPVKSIISTLDIQTIWFFSFATNGVRYKVYTLEMAKQNALKLGTDDIDETWIFDCLTNKSLNRVPKSGLRFKDNQEDVKTRGRVTIEWCRDVYAGTDTPAGYKGRKCWSFDAGSDGIDNIERLDIFSDSDGGGGSDDFWDYGGGGGGSAGSSDSTDPAPDPYTPKARAIFRNTNMTEENWKVIEKMLDKMILDCLGEALYTGLKGYLGGKTLTIQFTKDGNSSFGDYGKSVGITLDMTNESNRLFHEMFHAYQSYQDDIHGFNNSSLNYEIEAHYAQYLYLSNLPEYAGSIWEEGYKEDIRLRSIRNLSIYINKYGELYPNILESKLDLYIMNDVVSAFRSIGYPANKFPFNSNVIGSSNFNSLQQLTKDC